LKKKILVTGSSGFIGSNLLLKLTKNKNYKVYGTIFKTKPKIKSKKIKYMRANLIKSKDCLRVTKNIDIVVMCAANSSGAKVMTTTPLVHLTSNLIMNAQMLEAAYYNKVKKFIFISSNTVYPEGKKAMKETDSNYEFFSKYHIVAWMKKFSEKMCEMYSLKIKEPMKTLVIRPANLYGPYDKFDWTKSKVIAATIRKVVEKKNPLVIWGDGKDLKDFLYIDDFIDALIKIMKSKKNKDFDIFNIASGSSVTIKQILNILIKLENLTHFEINYDTSMPSLIPVRKIDINKIKKKIKWKPKTKIVYGLKKTVHWYKNYRIKNF
jgi:GDP-L-fucose synthase